MWTKKCSTCGADKPIGEFAVNVFSPDSLTFDCVACGAVGLDEGVSLRLQTAQRHYEIGAAAFANGDVERVSFFVGRLDELNKDHTAALRVMLRGLMDALDNV